MRDHSRDPLTPAEKLVYGEHAKRRPDGSIIEQGSSHVPEIVAHREALTERAIAALKKAQEESAPVEPEPEPEVHHEKPKHKPKAHK